MVAAAAVEGADVVVVGAGHNGLVCACYLAAAGLDVVVLEQADAPGGGSRTEETVPGYRFDTHSVAHNLINMTDVPEELDLAGAGLRYREMDPFSVAVATDGGIIRFHRDVDATVDSIRAVAPEDAEAYARFLHAALPLVRAAIAGIEGGASRRRRLRQLPGRLVSAAQALHRAEGVRPLARQVLAPYGALLEAALPSERTRAPVAAFAAHAGASPSRPGTGLFGLWQAAYHLYGQWHAVGGAQGLTDALVHRLTSLGGRIECGFRVASIPAAAGRVSGVRGEDGRWVAAPVVVTATDVRLALLHLLEPPLGPPEGGRLAAAHRGNAVQALVHVATDALPPYPEGRPGDWNGLQSFVDSLDDLRAGFAAAEAGRLPTAPVPTYAFTTSALDGSLAPPGGHTVYLACPCAPARLEAAGGWTAAAQGFAEAMLDSVEARAPGFRSTIRGMDIRTPERMARELAWPGAHPMHLDITLDQLGSLRPTPGLADHRTPVAGLYVTGAGTAPVGGIAGTPGRSAARKVLADRRRSAGVRGDRSGHL